MGRRRLSHNQETQVVARYREALTSFSAPELLWDLGCQVPDWIRAHILAEFARRGIDPDEARRTHGRGKPRPS